jgi:hypothetical protein
MESNHVEEGEGQTTLGSPQEEDVIIASPLWRTIRLLRPEPFVAMTEWNPMLLLLSTRAWPR